MSKSNALENALLELIFKATAFADVAENDASSPITDIYVSLHTGDPGEAGDQTTNEISYTGYARVAVVRSGVGWVVTGNSVSPAADVTFGQMTAGAGGTVTHAGIGKSVSGAGVLFYSGAVSPNIAVVNGVTPIIAAGSTIVED